MKRSAPYFRVLSITPSKVNRIAILKKFPDFVVNDIIELLLNIVRGNLKVRSKHKNILQRQKKPMLNLIKTIGQKRSSNRMRRNLIYKQKGGFLGAVIPIIASLIGGLAANV